MKKNNDKFSDIINYLEDLINERSKFKNKSYTAELINKGLNRISQKVGEEAIEVVIAATKKDKKQVIYESADLVFHLLVLWKKLEIKSSDIAKELITRKNNE